MPSMSVVDRLANIWDASLHRILRLVSVETASAVGSFVVRANVRLHRRDIIAGARRNLAIHRPELTEPEIRAFIWRFIDNVGRFMGEFSVLSRMQEERRIELIGAEALKAIDGVEPVVVIGLHTGNWEVFGHPLRDAGLKLATFYETPPRPAQERIVLETRREAGWQLLDPSPRGMREAMSLLKQKRVIVIFGDEARNGRLMAPLFGRPPHASGNLALGVRLARRTGAKLFIGHCERLEGCRFKAYFSEPFSLPAEDAGVLADVAFVNAKIEPIVLANLDRWYYLDDLIAPFEDGKA